MIFKKIRKDLLLKNEEIDLYKKLKVHLGVINESFTFLRHL